MNISPETLLKLVQSAFLLHGDVKNILFISIIQKFGLFYHFCGVGFIYDDQSLFAADKLKYFPVLRGKALASVQHHKNYVGVFPLFFLTCQHRSFPRRRRFPYARRIDYSDGYSAHVHIFLHRVPCRSGNIGDYGSVLHKQVVEQGAFSDIRTSEYNGFHSLTDYASRSGGINQFFELGSEDVILLFISSLVSSSTSCSG